MRRLSLYVKYAFAACCLMAVVTTTLGCKKNPEVVPVAGKVLYNGKPLPFGIVMFQPEVGQAAQGEIQPDGSFQLSSYLPNDGAVPGRHKISIRCFSGQKTADGGGPPGRLLIPQKYTRFGTSGLTAEIANGANEPLVLELKGPPLPKGL